MIGRRIRLRITPRRRERTPSERALAQDLPDSEEDELRGRAVVVDDPHQGAFGCTPCLPTPFGFRAHGVGRLRSRRCSAASSPRTPR